MKEAAISVTKKLGVRFDDSNIFRTKHDLSSGRNSARNFLMSKNISLPCLIFCVSDQIAIGVTKELTEAKIKIPEEMGILGFSDLDLCALVTPTISSVSQHIKKLGEQAAELFIKVMDGIYINEKNFFSEYTLVERETT